MEIYIPQFGFLLLILVIPDVSTRGNPPFNNLTYVYRISRKVANTVPIFDETTFDSVIQCGVFCVSNPKCYSAFFSIEEGICMLSEDTLDTYFMSPSYQAWVEDLGSILYIDLDGWKPAPSTTPSTTEATTITTTTTPPATTTPATTTITVATSTTTTTQTTTTVGATPIDFAIGDRVMRGPDWLWGDQDGGGQGTISRVVGFAPGWTQVTWDNGYTDDYRNGAEGKVDLIKIS